MSSLKKLKAVGKRSKYCVFGFIRESELLLKLSTIPRLINFLCLSYFHIKDFFLKARKPEFIISNDGLQIKNINGCRYDCHSIYLNEWIHSESKVIAVWTLKMGANDSVIGLSSSDTMIENDFTFHGKKPNYAVGSHGVGYINSLKDDKYNERCNGGYNNFFEDDIVRFILDLKHGNICMAINDQDVIILFEDIEQSTDVRYKLVLQLPRQDDYVIIQDFAVFT